MVNEQIEDYERKERKDIVNGTQKTLTPESPENKIDESIVDLFSTHIKLNKVIVSNDNEFEAIVDGFHINTTNFRNINKVSKEIYGNDCLFHFNAESKWNISFGVIKNANKN